MIINLNQREIEAALKVYLTSQGINLGNKTVDINFTAGRKETGISAELDIGDAVGAAPPVNRLSRGLKAVVSEPAPESDEAKGEEYPDQAQAEKFTKSAVSLFS